MRSGTKISSTAQNLILAGFCLLAFISFYRFSSYLFTFEKSQIQTDVIEYYSFVPAVFECNDLSFKNGCPPNSWIPPNQQGKVVNKRTVGMAYMYTPFYLLSGVISGNSGENSHAYSRLTQNYLVIGMWIYVCLGLFVLGKALFHFFDVFSVLLTLATIVAATNILWYTNGEVLFSHGVNFMWLAIIIWSTIRYFHTEKLRWLLLLSFSLSMITLIRPVNLMFGLFPVLYGVNNKQSFIEKFQFLKSKFSHILWALVIFLIPIIPQLMYWKYASGQWIYYSYSNEGFFWGRPMILQLLFSFRKGWLIYTPVMGLSLLGFLYMHKRAKPIMAPLLIIFGLFLYITSCWWAWSYGGSYGMRPMVDIYPLLAFPLCALICWARWFIKIPILAVCVFCSVLNIFQVWQYRMGILHYDGMTKETYLSIWKKEKYPQGYDLTIAYPDYSKEIQGKSPYNNLEDITNQSNSLRFLRARFTCSLDSFSLGLNAKHYDATTCDAFDFVYNNADQKYLIRAHESGRYWKLDTQSGFILLNDGNPLTATSFHVLSLENNKFAIRAPNGFWISAADRNARRLRADASQIEPECYVVISRYLF